MMLTFVIITFFHVTKILMTKSKIHGGYVREHVSKIKLDR
jgi:hypothetical protein